MNRIQIISVKEVVNSQSRPYIVLGEDLNVYYSKFAVGVSDSIDLYYEFVCKEVGALLGIPLPDSCLMEYDPKLFVANFPSLNIPLLGFGSKEISPNQIMAEKTDFIKSKHDFNRIPNPLDLIKIGIFDLHFMNNDRGSANFNLIQSTGKIDPNMIYAINHVQCFGGAMYKKSLIPAAADSIGANILRTDYGRAICKYLGKDVINEVLLQYFDTFHLESERIINIIGSTPPEWFIQSETKQRLERFIMDKSRNKSVLDAMNAYFAYF